MARLCAPPKNTLLRDLPEKDKIKLALEWLHENPDEKPATAARLLPYQEGEFSSKGMGAREKKARGGA
jgi:hypothetical protein